MSQGTASRWSRQRHPGETVSDTVSEETVSPTVSDEARTVTVADVAAAAKGEEDRQEVVEYVGPPSFAVSFGVAAEQLRFVSNSPGSLLDQIEYAREGAYTNRVNGPWRTANIVFAKYIAAPGLGICYFIGWALFTRLSRTLTCGPLILLVLMLLNHLPVTEWVVPDCLDFTHWFGWN